MSCEGHGHAGAWLTQAACAGADGAGGEEPSWGWGLNGHASSQGVNRHWRSGIAMEVCAWGAASATLPLRNGKNEPKEEEGLVCLDLVCMC